jgi:tRNA threonylcarbamoyladenosine biosynthesis protein TsaB
MIYILSIETSTTVCSVALHGDGQLLGHSSLYLEKSHATQLAPLIGQLLRASEVDRKQLSALGLSAGPGSYTGLRIGASLAKGLCYALQIPLIAVNTLEGMVRQVMPYVEENDVLCPMLDARRMEVYTLLARADGEVMQPTRACILEENSFEEQLEQGRIWFFGNGSDKARETIRHRNARFLGSVTTEAWAIGELAIRRFEMEAFEDIAYFEPFYLKEFQATKPKKKI